MDIERSYCIIESFSSAKMLRNRKVCTVKFYGPLPSDV